MKEDNNTDLTLEEIDKLFNEDIEKFNALPPKVKILYRVSRISNILGDTSKEALLKGSELLKEVSTKRS